MLLINAKILTEDWKFVSADLRVSNGKIADLGVDLPFDEDLVIDCNGGYLIPGLVETHFHGALGEDAHKPTENTLDAFSRFEVSRGITTFVAGPGSVSDDAVKYFLHLSKTFMAQKPSGAKMAGIYLEGPFVSYTRRGGHAPDRMRRAEQCAGKRRHFRRGRTDLCGFRHGGLLRFQWGGLLQDRFRCSGLLR